ncbi:MAG: YgeY family selenium metabolism-linked hydrolase [Lachnospiraceae bacterium]|nr:YgeY family selenium metabolism-linked hydrolase [Lachnospiraceae bacterium]
MNKEQGKRFTQLYEAHKEELVEFYRSAIRIPSFSNQEKPLAELIVSKMKELGYDEAYIDPTGNAVGRVGDGPEIIHFDGHMDVVGVPDAELWVSPPFEANIVDGMVYGRGSVDMKGGLSAAIYAAALAKKAGLLDGKTVYVTGTVCEEYCDGVCLEHFYKDSGVKPDYCVICEPSNNVITLGHTGKVQVLITTHGVSAHGSAPEKGINAVYEMAEIITRVDELNRRLSRTDGGGTVVLSQISCKSASVNAVPNECSIYLDRRLRLEETTEQVRKEMDELIAGKRASWASGDLHFDSWTGEKLDYVPIHDPWKTDVNHPLIQAGNRAYTAAFGCAPQEYDFWDFSTNAVVPVPMGVTCIGFGPGVYKLAHMRDECCDPRQVQEACSFYTHLIEEL